MKKIEIPARVLEYMETRLFSAKCELKRNKGQGQDPLIRLGTRVRVAEEMRADLQRMTRGAYVYEEKIVHEPVKDDADRNENDPGQKCGNCDGRGSWWARDPDTNEILRDTDGLRMVYECGRCKGTGKEPE